MSNEPGVNETLVGKTILVTGATSGIGLVTAQALAKRGATLILVGRDHERCLETADRLRRDTNNTAIEPMVADLSYQQDIRTLAENVRARYPRLDVLINNAGGMFSPRQESRDGIEMTWALNHLAYFLLTNLLLDTLKASAPSRIVSVASDAHRMASGINFDDPESKKNYKPFRAYAQSKLANILFTRELAKRLEGTRVTANCLHPGFVSTRFFQKQGFIFTLMKLIAPLMAINPDSGAKTSIYLAASPKVEGISGLYFAKEAPATPRPAALDDSAAARLWKLSETMTGLPPSA